MNAVFMTSLSMNKRNSNQFQQVGNLIYYKKVIHEVKEICPPFYKIIEFDADSTPQPFRINQQDPEIQTIFKDVQSNIKKANNFKNRYNKEIVDINENPSTIHTFKLLSLDFLIQYSIQTRLFSLKSMNKLPFVLKKTRNPTLQLHNIIRNPMDFILPEYIFISYKKAHEICEEFGIIIEFKIKIEKWSYDLMHSFHSFYIPFNRFIERFKEFCALNHEKYADVIETMNQLVINKTINGQHFRTTRNLLEIENRLTNQLIELFHNKQFHISRQQIQVYISLFETTENIIFNEKQLEAIYGAIANKLYIIHGFPGTGKSTIVKCILFIFSEISKETQPLKILEGDSPTEEDEDEDIEYITESKYPKQQRISILAPTGLAYVGLSAKCKMSVPLFQEELSGTCHRIIYGKFDRDTEKRDLIIIDEFSMIDIFMLKDIIEWCNTFQCRLLIIGDENQLPSIGPGICLKNMIQTNIFPQTKLLDIKRQNGLLMRNIKMMTTHVLLPLHLTDDTMKILSIRDFINVETNTLKISKITELFAVEEFTLLNTKVLTYFKDEKYVCNMNNLNSIFQDLFNPSGSVIPSPTAHYKNKPELYQFREGDLIIRTENDYSSEPFRANGECAHITSFYRGVARIKYIDDPITVKPIEVSTHTLYDEFSLAYALTVHKSQGSQYPNVIYLIEPSCSIIEKKAIYTAISRAKERCIVISNETDFINSQKKIDNKVSLFMEDSDTYDI